MNRNIIIISGVVIASLVGISVFISSDINQPISRDNSVIIAMDLWAGFAHAYVAQEKGFFENEGVNVELQLKERIASNYQDFENGKIDAVLGPQANAMELYARGVPLKIVYVVDFSNGGNVLISNPNIKAVSDLQGKKVSVDNINDFTHIFLVELLRKNGLEESDVEIIPVPGNKILDALESGLIDAGQTWEPFQSDVIASGYTVLASSADAPGIITDVLIFHSKFVEERPDDVKKIIRAMDRALKYRNVDYIGSYSIMSDATGISPSDLKRSIGGNSFPNLEENKESFTESEKSTSLYSSGKIISDFFLEKGIISAPINLKDLLATEIIMEL